MNINDDYVCTVDSHVYLHRFEPEGFEDAIQFDYGPEYEHAPWLIADTALKHYGTQNWNRRCMHTFPYRCDVIWYSIDPFICFPRHVVKALRDLYGKYGLWIIPWHGYGSDGDQAFVSATRLLGPAKCSKKTIFGHRHNLTPGYKFWQERWRDEWYRTEWYQANACFLKLHYPRELWKLAPFDPTKCRYVPDDVARRIQDDFRYDYRDFLRWAINYASGEDRRMFEEEGRILGLW